MELVSRMMDGSFAYDSKARLEPVASGATVNQGDKIERLKEVPIFEGCSQRQLRSVARIARVFEAPAGTVLTRADELGDEFFLLLDGTASVEVAAEQRVLLQPGAFFSRSRSRLLRAAAEPGEAAAPGAAVRVAGRGAPSRSRRFQPP